MSSRRCARDETADRREQSSRPGRVSRCCESDSKGWPLAEDDCSKHRRSGVTRTTDTPSAPAAGGFLRKVVRNSQKAPVRSPPATHSRVTCSRFAIPRRSLRSRLAFAARLIPFRCSSFACSVAAQDRDCTRHRLSGTDVLSITICLNPPSETRRQQIQTLVYPESRYGESARRVFGGRRRPVRARRALRSRHRRG